MLRLWGISDCYLCCSRDLVYSQEEVSRGLMLMIKIDNL